jgi:hypothetical protein
MTGDAAGLYGARAAISYVEYDAVKFIHPINSILENKFHAWGSPRNFPDFLQEFPDIPQGFPRIPTRFPQKISQGLPRPPRVFPQKK